jgi:hypothetical protein
LSEGLLLPEKFRSLFRKESGTDSPGKGPSDSPQRGGLKARKSAPWETTVTRQSRGLEQFFFNIRDTVGLSILDLAGANQENITFLTSLGHRVYSQDLTRTLDEAFGPDLAEQTNSSRIDYFLQQNFDYPPDTFDGVLLWDSLQFMGTPLLNATIERLHTLMSRRSYLLAFFTANERSAEVPSHSFRIVDDKNLLVTMRGTRPAGQVFNNRNLEKVFAKFESVKFFLTRDSLREVIVKR